MKRNLWRILLIIFLIISTAAVAVVVTGSSEPVISVDPPSVIGIYPEDPDPTFTVDITVASVSEEESLYGWQIGMSFDPNVLQAGISKTDMWTGDGEQTVFETTREPVVQDSEKVYVNETLMSKPYDYAINYKVGNITFKKTAPGVGAEIKAVYLYGITEGPFLSDVGATSWWVMPLLKVDNVAGTVDAANALYGFPSQGAIGSGVLCNIAFQVKDVGRSTLHFYKVELRTYDGTKIIMIEPVGANDGLFTNVHDVAITNVEAKPQVNRSETVYVNVTVANEGAFTETFDVAAYYDDTAIESQKTVSNLAPLDEKTLTFTWDTSPVSAGNKTITAKITTVIPDEINITNNEYPWGSLPPCVVEVVQLGAPIARFTYSQPVVAGEEATFNASDSQPASNRTIASYKWNFGDGTPIVVKQGAQNYTVTHTYATNGPHTLESTVTDDESKDHTLSKKIQVLAYPLAIFNYKWNETYSPDYPLVNHPVNFNASLSGPEGGSITSYTWNFGDGNTTKVIKFGSGEKYWDSDFNRHYSFGEPIYEDIDKPEKNSVSPGDLRLIPPPVGGYKANSVVKEGDIDISTNLTGFQDEGHRENVLEDGKFEYGEIITLEWWLEEYAYGDNGTFTVGLTVTDSEGLSNTALQTITTIRKHDVKVVDLDYCDYPSKPSKPKTIYVGGTTLGVKVTIKNEGSETETFNITLYCDETEIETLEVANLVALEARTIYAQKGWNVADFSGGDHYLMAEIPPVSGEKETDIADNSKQIGPIFLHEVNVAIADVVPSQTIVLAGDVLNVSVTIQNEGTGKLESRPLLWVYYNTSTTSTNNTITLDALDKDAVVTEVFTWDTTDASPGNYTLSAYITPLKTPAPESSAEDNLFIYGNITIGASMISLYAFPEKITVGSTITLNGSITPARPGVNVTIQYRLGEEESWHTIGTVPTDGNSTYSYDWKPEKAGTYEVKAIWGGDNETLSSESETLIITVDSAPLNVFLYVVAAVAIIVMAATAIYLLRFRKPKPA